MTEMNTMLHVEKGLAEVVERPMPHPKEGFVLVEQVYTPICVDQRAYDIGYWEFYEGPYLMGHEGVGAVAEVGPGVTGVQEGDRVIIYQGWPCMKCWVCNHGLSPTHCMNCKKYGDIQEYNGADSGGAGLNRFRLVPWFMVQQIPDSLDFFHAAAANCLVGCAYTAVKEREVTAETYALVAGIGFVGHGTIANLKHRGATTIALGRNPFRMDLARRVGVDHVVNPDDQDWLEQVRALTPQNRGVDVAFECSGYPYYQQRCLASLRNYGTLHFLGYAEHENLRLELNVEPQIQRRHLQLTANHDVRFIDRSDLLELLQTPGIQEKIDIMVTHTFPMSHAEKAFETILSKGAGKVYLDPRA